MLSQLCRDESVSGTTTAKIMSQTVPPLTNFFRTTSYRDKLKLQRDLEGCKCRSGCIMVLLLLLYPFFGLVTLQDGDTMVKAVPPGHLEPLGSHAKQLGGIPFIGHFPSPNVFYTEFVEEARPVIMSRALEVDDYPAYKLWTDAFLSNKFGDEVCEVDKGREKNRKLGEPVNIELRDFLQYYTTEDMLLFQEVPDPMKGYVRIPFSLECGGYVRGLQPVTVWLSNGGTKSYLHKDSLHNMVCLLDGSSSIFMIDKTHHVEIEADGWDVDGSFSRVDVDKVDMNAFPQLIDVPYHEVQINKGDCLYIPEGWYRFMKTHSGMRNMALNFRFYHLHWFNMSDCEGIQPFQKSSRTLGSVRSSAAEREHRMPFLDIFRGMPPLGLEQFEELIQRRVEQPLSMTQRDTISKVFENIDADSSGEVSWEELYLIDMDQIIEYLSQAFQDTSVLYFPQKHILDRNLQKQNIQDKDNMVQHDEKEMIKDKQSYNKQKTDCTENDENKEKDSVNLKESLQRKEEKADTIIEKQFVDTTIMTEHMSNDKDGDKKHKDVHSEL